MESQRQQKISRLLQRDLASIFMKDANLLAPGTMITVTKVYVTKDLGIAKVYLSMFGGGENEEVLAKVRKRGSDIRYQLGNMVRNQLRAVPELQFFEDDSLDYIENIENLLND